MNKFLEKCGHSVNGQLTPKFFEEWAKRHCMKPVCIVRDPGVDILLADSGEPVRKGNGDGVAFYRTGYSLHRSGLEIGNFNDYPEYPACETTQAPCAIADQPRPNVFPVSLGVSFCPYAPG